jgi:hypothetical protein
MLNSTTIMTHQVAIATFSMLAAFAADPSLPSGAVVIETAQLPRSAHPNRALVLWMEHPVSHDDYHEPEAYTCPDYTRGSYFSGPTRVSLVNTRSGAVINTVHVEELWTEVPNDSFDVPYRIRPFCYRVDRPGRNGEGKPKIINLKNYTGDGPPLEFALFDAQNCSITKTSLIGYSVPGDRVIRYPIHLDEWIGEHNIAVFWLDDLFTHQPVEPGQWHYQKQFVDVENTYDVRYGPAREEFTGTVLSRHLR